MLEPGFLVSGFPCLPVSLSVCLPALGSSARQKIPQSAQLFVRCFGHLVVPEGQLHHLHVLASGLGNLDQQLRGLRRRHLVARRMVLTAHPLNWIDTTGVEVFGTLQSQPHAQGIALHLLGLKLPVERVQKRQGFWMSPCCPGLSRTEAEALEADWSEDTIAAASACICLHRVHVKQAAVLWSASTCADVKNLTVLIETQQTVSENFTVAWLRIPSGFASL